ncbi:MAG: hypothetical protein KA749_00065 [Acidovorax sp.]|nr:hypothetical protein [Acidovorax sp.]
MAKIVTISGKDYEFDALSPTAQNLIVSVTAADARLEQLRAELSMIQLARDVYVKSLVESLPKGDVSPAAAAAPVH